MKLTLLVPLLSLALFACGGDDEPAAERTPTPTASATAEAKDPGGEEAIREMFTDYVAALGARDWDVACVHLAPETTDKLKSNIAQLNIPNAPDDCPGLMDALYSRIDQDPETKKTIDDITATANVSEIKITGETASVTWSAKVDGVETPVTQSARIVDGEWKLIDVN